MRVPRMHAFVTHQRVDRYMFLPPQHGDIVTSADVLL